MKKTVLSVFCFSLFLSACMSAPQPYDGFIGYETSAHSSGETGVTYIDQARFSWEKMAGKAKKACGIALRQRPDMIKMEVLEQQSFARNVDIQVPIPTGFTATGDTKTNSGSTGKPVSMMKSDSYNQGEKVSMKFRKIRATCSIR